MLDKFNKAYLRIISEQVNEDPKDLEDPASKVFESGKKYTLSVNDFDPYVDSRYVGDDDEISKNSLQKQISDELKGKGVIALVDRYNGDGTFTITFEFSGNDETCEELAEKFDETAFGDCLRGYTINGEDYAEIECC